MLDDTDIDRYSRQILLPEIGGKGQLRLRQSSVVVIGEEAAAIAALYLAAAGIGRVATRLSAAATHGLPPHALSELPAASDDEALRCAVAIVTWPPHPPDLLAHRSRAGGSSIVLFDSSSGAGVRTVLPDEFEQLEPPTPQGFMDAAMAGSIAATEALRLVLGQPPTLHGAWLRFTT